jgi:hypothetical protein
MLLQTHPVISAIEESQLKENYTNLLQTLSKLHEDQLTLAKHNKRQYLTKVYHNENARALSRVIQMLNDIKKV